MPMHCPRCQSTLRRNPDSQSLICTGLTPHGFDLLYLHGDVIAVRPAPFPDEGVRGYCAQHTSAAATSSCAACGLGSCSLCTFILPSGERLCPHCACEPVSAYPSQRLVLLFGAYVAAMISLSLTVATIVLSSPGFDLLIMAFAFSGAALVMSALTFHPVLPNTRWVDGGLYLSFFSVLMVYLPVAAEILA